MTHPVPSWRQVIPSVSTTEAWFAGTWPVVLEALAALVVTLVALRLAGSWSTRAMGRARVEPSTRILVRRTLRTGIVVLGAVVVLGILGVSPATLVTVVGAVGLAFSLAMQDILKNFFSGIYLLLERPFRVGDTIRVKDQQGAVEHIGVRTTLLRTPENVYVLVPNAIVFAEVVSNHSHTKEVPPAPVGGAISATTPGGATPTPHQANPAAAMDQSAKVSPPASPSTTPR